MSSLGFFFYWSLIANEVSGMPHDLGEVNEMKHNNFHVTPGIDTSSCGVAWSETICSANLSIIIPQSAASEEEARIVSSPFTIHINQNCGRQNWQSEEDLSGKKKLKALDQPRRIWMWTYLNNRVEILNEECVYQDQRIVQL